jgi:hypothetical protein
MSKGIQVVGVGEDGETNTVDLEVYDVNIFPAHVSYAGIFAIELKVRNHKAKDDAKAATKDVTFSPTYFTFDAEYYGGEYPRSVKCRALANHIIYIGKGDDLCKFVQDKIRAFCEARRLRLKKM